MFYEELIEECLPSELERREQYWVSFHDGSLLNLAEVIKCPASKPVFAITEGNTARFYSAVDAAASLGVSAKQIKNALKTHRSYGGIFFSS
jgi:hypothetical protein